MTTLQHIQDTVTERCGQIFFPINAWGPAQWGNALQGEAGEAGNFLKKLERDAIRDGIHFEKVISHDYAGDARYIKHIHNVGLELADTVLYSALTASRLGISLEEYCRVKFNQVSIERGSELRL